MSEQRETRILDTPSRTRVRSEKEKAALARGYAANDRMKARAAEANGELRVSVRVEDLALILSGCSPTTEKMAQTHQRLAEITNHAQGRLAPWESP